MIGGAFLGLPTGGKAGRVHRPTTAIMIDAPSSTWRQPPWWCSGWPARRGAGQVHRRPVDDVDPELRPLRPHPADVHRKTGSRSASSRSAPGRRSGTPRTETVTSLFVHARTAEEKFVADGDGVARFDVMYNDFVIVGPPSDPAGVAGMAGAVAALAKIAGGRGAFCLARRRQRHPQGGARALEGGGVDVEAASGGWYRETGSGMGATLNIGTGMGAYVMTGPRHLDRLRQQGRAPDRGRG